jgi:5-methylthioadenosine/S-adenosylhomocysteine deaminase
MFHAMKMALVLHRGAYGRSVVPTPQRIFDYATVNAARALDRPDIGRIEVGMKADLAMIDLGAPAMTPRISAISNLVHYGHPGIVTDTMVDGRFLMRDRVLTTIDESSAVEDAQTATDAMWVRFGATDRGVPMPTRDAV